jgi:hypothetical protein
MSAESSGKDELEHSGMAGIATELNAVDDLGGDAIGTERLNRTGWEDQEKEEHGSDRQERTQLSEGGW